MTDTDVSAPVRERLARICAGRYWDHALQGPLGNAWITREKFVDTRWAAFLGDVDAILAEMQEPSEGMLEAGMNAGGTCDRQFEPERHIWQAIVGHIREGGS